MATLSFLAPDRFPDVQSCDSLAELIANAFTNEDTQARAGDIVVLAQKIVFKSEGRHRCIERSFGAGVGRGIAAAGGPRCQRTTYSTSTEPTAWRAAGSDHQRQLGASLAQRHHWIEAGSGWHARAAGPARHAGSLGPAPDDDRGGNCRRSGRRRLGTDGASCRGATGRAGARLPTCLAPCQRPGIGADSTA